MKVAKNKKSAFVNLFEVLSKLDPVELIKFSSFLKAKRRVTKYNEYLKLVVGLINSNESVDTIDETKIKKQVESDNISSDFNKITENLYSRLLSFLSDLYKQDEWKKWQVEANDRLLEVETLMKRELDSQAIAHLLKLEDKLKEKGDYSKWIYDDIGIYSRLAHLKIELSYKCKDLKIDEFDKLLYNLLQLGSYFYNNKLDVPNDEFLRNYKYIGYQILSEFFEKTKDYNSAVDAINRALENVNSLERDSKVVGIMHHYFNMIKIFLGAKYNNEIPYECDYTLDSMPEITFVMLQEEVVNSIKISINHFEHLINEKDNDKYLVDKLFFAEVKIDCLPDRLELNRAILFYIRKDYAKCKEIIVHLKSFKRNTQIANPIFLQLLIIESLCKIKEKDYDTNSVTRSMNSCIKDRSDLKFETVAIKLLESYSKLTQFGRNEYPAKSKDDISGLMELKDITNPIHTLILMTLKNEV